MQLSRKLGHISLHNINEALVQSHQNLCNEWVKNNNVVLHDRICYMDWITDVNALRVPKNNPHSHCKCGMSQRFAGSYCNVFLVQTRWLPCDHRLMRCSQENKPYLKVQVQAFVARVGICFWGSHGVLIPE